MSDELSMLFACPNCGSSSPNHAMMKISTRPLADGSLCQFIECNVCGNCDHEWPLEDLSGLFGELK